MESWAGRAEAGRRWAGKRRQGWQVETIEGREKIENLKKWWKEMRRHTTIDKNSDVSYCRYCAAVRWEPGVFTGPHTRCLCRHRTEQVKIGTQCSTWLYVHVVTCVCVAPLALHSIAICCWRNSSWQEVTCNAVAMATYERCSKDIQINALFICHF